MECTPPALDYKKMYSWATVAASMVPPAKSLNWFLSSSSPNSLFLHRIIPNFHVKCVQPQNESQPHSLKKKELKFNKTDKSSVQFYS